MSKIAKSTNLFRPFCVICGTPSALISLTESDDCNLLKYGGPGGSNGNGDEITAERARSIIMAFTKPYESARIRKANFYDDAGFCLECENFYCSEHWSITPAGGGWCPEGHFKSLDPHWSPDSS